MRNSVHASRDNHQILRAAVLFTLELKKKETAGTHFFHGFPSVFFSDFCHPQGEKETARNPTGFRTSSFSQRCEGGRKNPLVLFFSSQFSFTQPG
jgi:hypothetical protein